MADISAADVMKLRKMTGQGMMDCKAALNESGGDVDKAVEILRRKGLATMAKRAERETSEGLVITRATADGGTAILATLCCETDFVAKSEDFKAAAAIMGEYAMACTQSEGAQSLAETQLKGKKFADLLTELVSKTGEKTLVGDYAKFTLSGPGLITTYIHFNGKVGAMVQIDAGSEAVAASDVIKRVAADVAMHITAAKPLALDHSGIDPDIVAREKAIFADQVKGKPAEIVDKIVEGKMKKFYAENCLLDQPFVKDDKKSVAEVVAEAARKAGGQAKVARFVRFEVG